MAKENQTDGLKIVAENRKARFLYEILETYEAGIQLIGTEVKSIRAGRINLQDGYALIRQGEVWLINVNIEQKGLTLVPLKVYLKKGIVKVQIGLGKGKKLHDKRETIKRREDQKEMQRVVKRY